MKSLIESKSIMTYCKIYIMITMDGAWTAVCLTNGGPPLFNQLLYITTHHSWQVVLIYNVASYWGITDASYAQINALADMYEGQNLVILGFPNNQFHKVL